MPLPEHSLRVAIAGATSLRGKDLKYWLEEGGFPAGEIRLVDEELASGTLTEAAGEPAIVQSVNESSFEGLRFVFFAGRIGKLKTFLIYHHSSLRSFLACECLYDLLSIESYSLSPPYTVLFDPPKTFGQLKQARQEFTQFLCPGIV